MAVGEKPALDRPSLVDEAEQAVRSWLAPGRFRRGDRLAPEHELASMLGISRGTLRSALRRLEDTGEIVRRQGSGTFVGRLASPIALGERLLRVESYSTNGRGERVVASLRIESRSVGARAARALAVGARERTTVISRTIGPAELPMVVTRDIFHPELVVPDGQALRPQLRAGHTMLDVLTTCGVAISYSRTRISPLLLSEADAIGRRLKLSGPTACLELEEVVLGPDGKPILWSRDVSAAGEMDIEVLQSVDAPHPGPIAGHDGPRNGDG